MAIPATAFWLLFGDAKLVSTTAGVGFGMAFICFGSILGQGFRLPIEKLPNRA